MADVIARAIEESRAAAPAGQQIESVIEPGLPIVLADREALKMAVKNLVLNAVKYGHGGPVRVSASGGSDVAIAVEDEGPGIPEEERRRIFEPFFRGRHAQAHEIEGSGIGLNIVKQVVKSHGGRVRVGGRRAPRHAVHPAIAGDEDGGARGRGAGRMSSAASRNGSSPSSFKTPGEARAPPALRSAGSLLVDG